MSTEIFVSQSRLSMLSKCGEQFRRVYIEGERRPPGVAMIVGSSVDDSVNANLQAKIDTGELLHASEVETIARDALDSRWAEEGVSLSDEEAEMGDGVAHGDAIDRSVRLARLHHAGVAPGLDPKAVQRRFKVRIKGETDIVLVGILDVEEPHAVRDTKTSRKSPAWNAADISQQLTMYSMGIGVEDGAYPDVVALDYLVDLKTPKAVTLTSTRGLEDFRVLLARIEAFTKVVQVGAFAPANPDDWWCSAKWCGFHGTCRYARQPVSVATETSKGES